MKNHVLVLGFGVASTAYVSVLDFNKIKTSVIGSPFDIKNIKNVKKKNKIFNINFSKNINFFYDYELGSIDIKSINLIIVGTNSNGIPWITKILNQIKKNCPILLITKGIINYKSKIIPISKYISLKCSSNKVVMASGPCLAKELINKSHTRTLFASKKIANANYVKNIFENEYYHPEVTKDIQGAEICSAIKNIYATVIGSSPRQVGSLSKNKYDNYFNTSSGLFEQSLKEMKYIVQKFGGNVDTTYGLAGAGDLYVSILGGRNARLGFYLGKGLLYKSIVRKQMKNITVEGAELIKSSGAKILFLVGQKKLPLLKSLLKAIKKNKKLKIDWKQFTF